MARGCSEILVHFPLYFNDEEFNGGIFTWREEIIIDAPKEYLPDNNANTPPIMARANTKIGDVFSVKIDDNCKKYLQYIVSDLTQLNSDVIRVFKKEYTLFDNPDLSEIVKGEVEFYAHSLTKLGLKMGYWVSVGNIADIGNFDEILFKSSGDSPQTKLSQNWWVWKINEDHKQVGKLQGENRNAEVGSVIPPDSIVYRIRTGKYDFVYPDFE